MVSLCTVFGINAKLWQWKSDKLGIVAGPHGKAVIGIEAWYWRCEYIFSGY